MDIVIFGAGSLGSLVGGVLAGADEHEVTLVGRPDHVEAVRTGGLTLEGEDVPGSEDGPLSGSGTQSGRIVHPTATTDGSNLEADLAVVTVKSFDTEAAAETLVTGAFDAVLSLQNGMGNEATLAERLEAPVLAGTATYGARLRGPGVVECTGLGEIVLGPHEGGTAPVAERVGAAFAAAGLETAVATDVSGRLWEKLAVNAGINAVTALARVENGAVLEGSANDLARAAARETARTARAEDVPLSNHEALAALEAVAEGTAANASSMLQDVRAGRRTEVDAINGYVVERAAAHRLDVPTNRTLAALVRSWERGRDVR